MQLSVKLWSILIGSTLLLSGCTKDQSYPTTLSGYLSSTSDLELSNELIACAGGMPEGWMGDAIHPTSVFFYPIDGATDFRYFETDGLVDDILDYSAFNAKALDDEPVFNGKLHRFKNTAFTGERWGIVTYRTPGKIHVCEAIRIKTNPKPTEDAPLLITVTENGTTPYFEWQDGITPENVIYFQVVTDMQNNVVSATYTYDKHWQFYDLSNVVLNVHDVNPSPSLLPNQDYKFILMGVSEDNWVNLMGEKVFQTH